MKFGDVKDNYTKLWNTCIVTDHKDIDPVCKQILINKPRYDGIAATTKVPWFIIACIHNLECSLDFGGCLHNGDPWNKVTVDVPKGLGPWKSFEEAAVDALTYDGMTFWSDWSVEGCLYKLELFNGPGYFNHGVTSPYLWSMTNQYGTPPNIGKYVKDRIFDPKAISDQVGCAAILKQLNCFSSISTTVPTSIQTYTKGANIQLSANFNSSEFDCPCKYPNCTTTLIDLSHLNNLQAKRTKLGKPIHIASGYNCAQYNKDLGRVTGSQHALGTATDITIGSMTPAQVAAEFDNFDGVGTFAGFTHVDSRGYHSQWIETA